MTDFAQPPRLTGNSDADFPALVEWVWAFYRQTILQQGVVQTTDFEAQMQEKFLRLFNLEAMSGAAADTVPYFTGASNWTITNFPTFGRQLVGSANADAVLALLGVTVYTNEHVDDRVSALIQNGTGITWAYDDGSNTLTPTVTITQYTDELAQDAVGAMAQNSTSVNLTYVDGTPSLTAETTGLDVTITTAKLTALGADGSMTFTKGVLTAQVQAT